MACQRKSIVVCARAAAAAVLLASLLATAHAAAAGPSAVCHVSKSWNTTFPGNPHGCFGNVLFTTAPTCLMVRASYGGNLSAIHMATGELAWQITGGPDVRLFTQNNVSPRVCALVFVCVTSMRCAPARCMPLKGTTDMPLHHRVPRLSSQVQLSPDGQALFMPAQMVDTRCFGIARVDAATGKVAWATPTCGTPVLYPSVLRLVVLPSRDGAETPSLVALAMDWTSPSGTHTSHVAVVDADTGALTYAGDELTTGLPLITVWAVQDLLPDGSPGLMLSVGVTSKTGSNATGLVYGFLGAGYPARVRKVNTTTVLGISPYRTLLPTPTPYSFVPQSGGKGVQPMGWAAEYLINGTVAWYEDTDALLGNSRVEASWSNAQGGSSFVYVYGVTSNQYANDTCAFYDVHTGKRSMLVAPSVVSAHAGDVTLASGRLVGAPDAPFAYVSVGMNSVIVDATKGTVAHNITLPNTFDLQVYGYAVSPAGNVITTFCNGPEVYGLPGPASAG